MALKCPYCNVVVEHLKYTAEFSEVASGKEWGTCDVDGDDQDRDDSETIDYSGYEQGDITYSCPHCDHELDIEDLIVVADPVAAASVSEKHTSNKPGDYPKKGVV